MHGSRLHFISELPSAIAGFGRHVDRTTHAGGLYYRPERIGESHCLFAPARGIAVSLDLRRVWNPGDKADRGPASFIVVRLHVENRTPTAVAARAVIVASGRIEK